MIDHFSDVLTILDSRNRVDAIIDRIRTHGIIEGFSQGKCLMKYVNRIDPVVLNDIVLTSGLGNIYPKGLKIGRITRIERASYGISQIIKVTPSVDFSNIEEVVVLIPNDVSDKNAEFEMLDQIKQ